MSEREKPATFFAVSSEEAIMEGRYPLAFFSTREEADRYRDHSFRTGIITEWMIDGGFVGQTKDNLVAVAMRIVDDRQLNAALSRVGDALGVGCCAGVDVPADGSDGPGGHTGKTLEEAALALRARAEKNA